MSRNGPGTVAVTLIAGMAALAAGELATRWRAEQWFTPTHRQSFSLFEGVPAMFFVAMLIFAAASALWRRVHAQPVIAAAIVTVACAGTMVILGGMALGLAMSGGAKADSVVTMMVLGGATAGVVALLAVGFLPIRDESRTSALVQAAIAFVALLVLVVPWPRLRLSLMSPAERDAHARRVYGATFDIARNTINDCPGFLQSIGGLRSLTISERRNMLERQPMYDLAYYDFDYIGAKQRGRVTVLFDYHRGNDRRRWIELTVYPRYSSEWTKIGCWLSPSLPPSP